MKKKKKVKEDDHELTACRWCNVYYDDRENDGYCDNCGGHPDEPPENDYDGFSTSSQAYWMDALTGSRLGK